MSVIGVKVLTDREGSQQEKWERDYTMTYLVETSNAYDGVNVVLRSPSAISHGVPQIGAYYVARGTGETDLGARCVDVRASHVDGDPRLWRIEAKFTSTDQKEDPEDQDTQTPNERKPTVSIRFEKIQIPLFADWMLQKGLCNSRNQPFSPPVMAERSRMVINITRYDTSLGLEDMRDWQDLINLDVFANFPRGTLKLNVADVHEEFIEGMRYWVKTFELSHNPDGWNPRVLDRGYKMDENGNFREILLDGFGEETTEDAPFFFEVDAYQFGVFLAIPAIRELHTGNF